MANTIKIGSTEIDNVLLGSTQVEKVYIGSNLAWENWVLNTGSLFEMTSNNTPSPFIVSSSGSSYPSGDWALFNSSTDVWNPQLVTNCIDKIDLVNPVRLAECQIKINYLAYDYTTFYIEASNDNSNWTELWNSGSRITSINETLVLDSLIEYRYYRVRHASSSGSGWLWEKFIITKWYTK